jgi:hypothetical protein
MKAVSTCSGQVDNADMWKQILLHKTGKKEDDWDGEKKWVRR